MDLKSVQAQYQDDIDAVTQWCDEIYQAKFASYFTEVEELYARLRSKSRPITDEELETILMMVPIDLFGVSEALNKFRLSNEVIKMKLKKVEKDAANASTESTATKRQEDAAIKMLSDKILQASYAAVITRVENQISFSRELIMSAKKLWDGRRRTEESNPVKEVSTDIKDIPSYDPITRQIYVK